MFIVHDHIRTMNDRDGAILVVLALTPLDQVLQYLGCTLSVADVLLGLFELFLELLDLGLIVNLLDMVESIHLVLLFQLCLSSATL